MALSVFDILRVSIGPSSSHTAGPMAAALAFTKSLADNQLLARVTRLRVTLMGSLTETGKGHETDIAVMVGLTGESAKTIDVASVHQLADHVTQTRKITLLKEKRIDFAPEVDIVWSHEVPSYHTNGIHFEAFEGDTLLASKRNYSIGGGFIAQSLAGKFDEVDPETAQGIIEREAPPNPIRFAKDMIDLVEKTGKRIDDLLFENECFWGEESAVNAGLDDLWRVMKETVTRGIQTEGVLPGPLKVKRRAHDLWRLCNTHKPSDSVFLDTIDWINAFTFAASEENAAGGRVVTAPTNGASGVIPGVLHAWLHFHPETTIQSVRRFLLVAGQIGILCKQNASISGAEVGCQGEVGVACSMAAAGLAYLFGGDIYQIENAAEIALEHSLGMTCDPVMGQVQIPCIERNAMAAVRAFDAARLAISGSGEHVISLDEAIHTMYVTGKDLPNQYKETSRGGLALIKGSRG